MIKDLRIGNYGRLWHFWGKRWTPILQLKGKHIGWIEEKKTDFDPIELNEEWLQRMGFDQEIKGHFENTYWDEDGGHKGLWIYSMSQAAKEYRAVVQNVNTKDAVFMKYIQHVHQLQNLFYTLTGEELTIKSDPIKA